MLPLNQHPIQNVEWVPVEDLEANDYNPNVVITPEMKLLKLSLLKQGWIQPVLVAREEGEDGALRRVIIDGFHRSTLTKLDPEVRALTDGKVPCCVLDLPRAERMLLTVRINRAKGSHVALKMHELVSALVETEGLTKNYVAEQIGATMAEIDLLLKEGVFAKLNIAEHQYSKAWTIKTED